MTLPALTGKYRIALALLLASLMLLTRSPQLGGMDLLHAGSWAIFFAGGVYLAGWLGLPLLLASAFLADALAVGWGGIAAYCLTPAYAMLLPAYASLWAAGRWYAARHQPRLSTILPLSAAVFAGALLCEIFSSGAFYWFSGQFAQPSLGEFLQREWIYFPAYLSTLCLWVAAGAALHLLISRLGGLAGRQAVDSAS